VLSGTRKVLDNDHSCAHVSIRQHTSAYDSIHQHTLAYVCIRVMLLEKDHSSANAEEAGSDEEATLRVTLHTPAYVSIRQCRGGRRRRRSHPSGHPAYASIRQHTSAYVNAEEAGSDEEATLRVTLHTSAYVSIRQHTSAYAA
jgi:hypothetical protein